MVCTLLVQHKHWWLSLAKGQFFGGQKRKTLGEKIKNVSQASSLPHWLSSQMFLRLLFKMWIVCCNSVYQRFPDHCFMFLLQRLATLWYLLPDILWESHSPENHCEWRGIASPFPKHLICTHYSHTQEQTTHYFCFLFTFSISVYWFNGKCLFELLFFVDNLVIFGHFAFIVRR